jgi:hypothetical protein
MLGRAGSTAQPATGQVTALRNYFLDEVGRGRVLAQGERVGSSQALDVSKGTTAQQRPNSNLIQGERRLRFLASTPPG